MSRFLALICVSTYFANALVLDDGVGKLPALGWNSWNAFGCDVDETKIMTAANSLVSLGLKDAGYEYVNIDDCWSVKSGRDSTTNQMLPDPSRFPSGISGVANSIHALGLKAGLYSDAGTLTCGGYPASIGYEYLDAATFAAWGIDYLKYDNCYIPSNWTDYYSSCNWEGSGPFPNGTCPSLSNPAPADYDWSQSNTSKRYEIMRDALLAQNRTILYSLCEIGIAEVWTWGNKTGSSWRMSGDITPSWSRIVYILNANSFLSHYGDFWGHNDADMLEVGNGLSLEESKSHFALWAAMKSPLIIGTALDTLSAELVDVLKNPYLLAFNQDGVYGKPAQPYKWGANSDWTWNGTSPAEFWSGQSQAGTLVLAFNPLETEVVKPILWSEVPQLGGGTSFEVTDIWTGESLGCVGTGFSPSVASHGTVGYLVGADCSQLSSGTSSSSGVVTETLQRSGTRKARHVLGRGV